MLNRLLAGQVTIDSGTPIGPAGEAIRYQIVREQEVALPEHDWTLLVLEVTQQDAAIRYGCLVPTHLNLNAAKVPGL